MPAAPRRAPRQVIRHIIQSWVTANKPSELADYPVFTKWGFKAPNFEVRRPNSWIEAYPVPRHKMLDVNS
jgi:hypothetical protein